MANNWFQKASVQTAIVSGLVLILVTVIVQWGPKTRLEGEVSALQGVVRRLETELAPFRALAIQRFGGPEDQALAKLATQLEELERKISPRKISEEQMRSMAMLLKESAGTQLSVISMNGFSEVINFSRALVVTFRAAHWMVSDPSTAIGGISGAGVFVVTKVGSRDFDELAKKVVDALTSNGVAANIASGPSSGPMAGTNTAPITLYVGDKP